MFVIAERSTSARKASPENVSLIVRWSGASSVMPTSIMAGRNSCAFADVIWNSTAIESGINFVKRRQNFKNEFRRWQDMFKLCTYFHRKIRTHS